MIRIHQLKERVTALRRRLTHHDDGRVEETWVEGVTLWARVKPLKPAESEPGEGWGDSKQRRSAAYAVTVRYQDRFRLDRLSWRGKTYALISAPIIDESRAWVSFLITRSRGNHE